MRKIFFSLVVLLTFLADSLVAQTYNMSTTSVSTCSGTFYDAGGTGNYGNSESYTMTFCSSVTGNQLQMTFSSFASENSFDKLLVYDGVGTGGTLLGTMTGSAMVMPLTYISTTGCLTFVWTSDGSTVNSGWEASISCIAPTLMSNGSVTSCSGVFYDSGNQSGNYADNESYTMTFCSPTPGNIMKFVFNTFNTQSGSDILTVYDGPNTSSPVIGTYSGTTSPGNIYSTDECITFVFTSNNSNNNAGWAASFSCIPAPGNNTCAGADPFCTGSTYNFPAGVNAGSGESGPNYGCLSSEPNPVWYYLKIATPGDIMISMSSSASVDIDFACWGPFSSPTSPCTAQLTATGTSWSSDNPHGTYPYPYGNLVDCSYNTAASEICYIPNGVVGQYYLLMITNFSNQVTNIIFSQTSGSGATDCSIVAPPVTNNGPICAGQTLQLHVSNPVAGATYAWTGPGNFLSNVMEPTITNATTANSGTYNLVITVGGVSSAPVSTTVVVNPNPVVTPLATPATICNGASSSLSASSTVAGSTYTWNPGSLSGSPVSVSPTTNTTYTVTATAAGCTGTSTVTVNVNPNITPSFTQLGPYCQGSSPAALPATSTNSITGTWSPSAISTSSAGSTTYTFTPNASFCASVQTMAITVNPLPVINFPALSSLCLGGSSLSLNSATPAGGTYNGTGVSANTFDPAVAGAGTFVITYNYTDANSCSSSATQNITVYNGPTANFSISPSPGCVQQAVAATYSGTGGSGCTYTWNFAGGSATPGTGAGPQQITFSTPGTYTITLTTSENGCSSAPYTQTVNIGLVAPTAAITHIISCNGGSDGQLTASPSGGAVPYTYLWSTSPAQLTQTASNIAVGSYTVTVTDAAGCTGTSSVNITEPTAMNADITDSTMVVCYGQNTGSATVTAFGGTQPYHYQWASNASTSNSANAYEAGNYSVTVNDNNGCSVVVPFSISQNPQMLLSLVPVNVGCENACDGEAALVISGGVAPYSYLWSPGGSTNLGITELCPGTYTVSVTDAENCVITDNTVINTNTFLTSFINVQPQSGIAPVEVTFNYSGTGATIFAWDFGDGSTSTVTSPSHIYTEPGTYTVNVVMSSGAPDFCMDSMKMEVTVYPPSTITIPNVFTPNIDGHNDIFTVQSEGLDTESMIIYNRWGRKVWEWNDVHGSWDGKMNSGGDASAGEYYYIFTAKGYDQKVYETNGLVTLLR